MKTFRQDGVPSHTVESFAPRGIPADVAVVASGTSTFAVPGAGAGGPFKQRQGGHMTFLTTGQAFELGRIADRCGPLAVHPLGGGQIAVEVTATPEPTGPTLAYALDGRGRVTDRWRIRRPGERPNHAVPAALTEPGTHTKGGIQ